MHKNRQNKLAMADFNKALEINPVNKAALNSRGCVWIALGEINKAIDDFNKMIEIDKNEDIGYYNRAVAWFKQGKEEKGLADFQKAIAINPNDNKYKTVKQFLKDRSS